MAKASLGDNSETSGGVDFRSCHMPLRTLSLPGPGEVHLWYLNLGELAGSLRQALGDDDRHGAGVPRGQLRFIRRFYLSLLLGAYLDLPGKDVKITRSMRGKPGLDPEHHDQSLNFSMAKSDDRLLIGLASSGDIGVDLEPDNRRAKDPGRLARRYFSATESAAITALPGDELDAAFLRAWSCKEAVVKASGQGIANQLCKFTIETDLAREPAILEFENEDLQAWALGVVRPDIGYTGAVATRNGGLEITARRLLNRSPA